MAMFILLSVSGLQAQKYLDVLETGKGKISPITFKALQDSMRMYFTGKNTGKGSGYKPWKRYEEWMKYHQYPGGTLGNIAANSYEAIKTLGTVNQHTSAVEGVTVNTGNWSNIGPVYNQGT